MLRDVFKNVTIRALMPRFAVKTIFSVLTVELEPTAKKELEDMKTEYYRELNKYFEKSKSVNSIKKPWYRDRVMDAVNKIVDMQTSVQKKTSCHYHLAKKFEIMEVSGEVVLIRKRNAASDPIVRIIAVEDFFEILQQVHKNTGHGGRIKMMENIKLKYYIPRSAVEIFVKLCVVCNMKRPCKKKL